MAAEDNQKDQRSAQCLAASSRVRREALGNNTLYSPASRRELRSVRAKQQQRRLSTNETKPIQSKKSPPKRSLSADFQFALDATEDATLGIKKNRAEGGVKLELRLAEDTRVERDRPTLSKRSASKAKLTLDELLSSHHKRRGRRRQRLMARGNRCRFELRKSLSYGQMQDLTRTLSQSCVLDLKESLHGVQQKRQQGGEQLAEQLANMFEAAVQETPLRGSDASLILPQVRKQILELTVETIVDVVQHLDQCQTNKEPIQWEFLLSKVDPENTLDWHNGKGMRQLERTFSQASGLGRANSELEDSFEEVSYDSWSSEEEEITLGSSQSSFIKTDDGQDYKGFKPLDDDDASDITGISMDAETECCDSSITMEECWSFGDPDESFALASSHHLVMELAEDFDASSYTEVEEFIEETEVEEEEIEEEEIKEEEQLEDALDASAEGVVDEEMTNPCESMADDPLGLASLERKTEALLASVNEILAQDEALAVLFDDSTGEVDKPQNAPEHIEPKENLPPQMPRKGSQWAAPSRYQPKRRMPPVSEEARCAKDRNNHERSTKLKPFTMPEQPQDLRGIRSANKSFRRIRKSRNVSSLIAMFEGGC